MFTSSFYEFPRISMSGRHLMYAQTVATYGKWRLVPFGAEQSQTILFLLLSNENLPQKQSSAGTVARTQLNLKVNVNKIVQMSEETAGMSYYVVIEIRSLKLSHLTITR